jgi:hypothetical protein
VVNVAGHKSLCEISFYVSFRGAEGDEESCTALKILRARFLAPLGMTRWTGFSHRLHKGRPGLTSPA